MSNRRRAVLLPLSLGVAGCDGGERYVHVPADLILTGGNVVTMDLSGPTGATAIAVTNGRVVGVGTDAGIAQWTGPNTVTESIAGKTVIPGLIDAHAHLVWGGEDLEIIDLTTATSMDDLLKAVSDYAAANRTKAWAQGAGWDAPTFEGQMDKSLLDAIVPDRPVCLTSADGHSVWVNSAALAEAGITGATPNPAGGEILHESDGTPTGVLREAAEDLVLNIIPPFTDDVDDAGLTAALALAHSHGITTVVDANFAEEVMKTYQRADAAGTLGMRIYGAVEVSPGLDFHQINAIAAERDDVAQASPSGLLHIDAAKFYLDGVIESETAYMLEPYEDGTNGPKLFSDTQLDQHFSQADAAGLQIHIHMIGDGAVRQGLDAIERLSADGPENSDRRPLFAHIEVIDPVDLPRFAELGVYADFQPLWAFPDTYISTLTIPKIGDDRAAWLYPIGDMVTSGANVVAGSDWDVSDNNPFAAMEVAITRQDPDNPADTLNVNEAVDLDTIMAAYTRDGARAVFGENELGTITVGKDADFAVLDQDPWAISTTQLSDVTVSSTWVNGAAVWRAPTGG